jgi:pullulanase/glycogen debranching enzyme
MANRKTLPGLPLPYGATLDNSGAQFSIFSRHAAQVTLVLFSSAEPNDPG